MKIHFREQYGTKGEEILYVTPAGKYLNRFVSFHKNTNQLITQNIDF